MAFRHPHVPVAFLLGLWLFAAPTSAAAQTSADLFNDQVLHEVRLLVNSRDLRILRTRWQENVYVPADMVWQGRRIRNVGIRSRGTGSRNPSKLGLKVSFDHYTKNQRFLGLKEVILDNLWQDPSLVREVLAMSVFRRMGQITPRESFAKVYINGEYQGLYALVESIDDVFLQRTLNETTGYLFEYRYVMPFFTEYLGESLAAYKPLFQPQNHEDESEEALYGPLRDLFRTATEADDSVWVDEVGARLDLAQFVTHVALQGFLGENDGILGYAGLNNFYVYRWAGTNRHRLIPWDEDYAFTFYDASLLRRGEVPVVIFERAFATPEFRTLFLDVAEACARDITGSGWLAEEIERVAGLVTAAALADTRKQYSNDDYLAQLDFLRLFASTRTATVLAEVQSLR